MVCNDDSLIVVSLSSLDNLLYAIVYSPYSLCYGIVYTRVPYHVTIGEVNHDEVILLSLDGTYQFVLYLKGAHLGFQIVGSNLRRGNQNTILTLVWSLTTTVEEEGDVRIFFRLCSMQLFLTLLRQILTKRILYVLLGEQDVHTCETGIIWCHAIVLQSRYCLHTLLRHILLSEHNGKFLGTIITEVDKDNHIALLNATIHGTIMNRFNELIGNTLSIALLYCLCHIGCLLTSAVHDKVVTLLNTLPTLVAVHSIETANDRSYGSIILSTHLGDLLYESLSTLRVGITTVHKTVNKRLVFQTIVLAHLYQFEEMVK